MNPSCQSLLKVMTLQIKSCQNKVLHITQVQILNPKKIIKNLIKQSFGANMKTLIQT